MLKTQVPYLISGHYLCQCTSMSYEIMQKVIAWHFFQNGNFLVLKLVVLTHWGRVTHICVSRPTITGSDNGLSPGRRQAIIWTNVGILLIGPLGTNFSENLIEILTFSFTKMPLKVSSAKWWQFCLGPNVLIWFLTTLHMFLIQTTLPTLTFSINYSRDWGSISSFTSDTS